MWEIIFGSLFSLLSVLISYIIFKQKRDHTENVKRIEKLEEMNIKLIDQNSKILNNIDYDIKKIMKILGGKSWKN